MRKIPTLRLLVHEGSWRRDMSHRHAAATILCVFTRRWHVAGTHVVATKSHCVHTNMSPMCEQHVIYWLQHVAATRASVMTPRAREPFKSIPDSFCRTRDQKKLRALETRMETFGVYTDALISKHSRDTPKHPLPPFPPSLPGIDSNQSFPLICLANEDFLGTSNAKDRQLVQKMLIHGVLSYNNTWNSQQITPCNKRNVTIFYCEVLFSYPYPPPPHSPKKKENNGTVQTNLKLTIGEQIMRNDYNYSKLHCDSTR